MRETRTINPHGRVLVNGIVLGKPYPGQAPKSTVADVGDNCALCHAIPLAEPGCAGPEPVRGVPAGTAELGVDWGVCGVAERGDGRAQIPYSAHIGE